jgi:3-keto-5-aminohexanoate cleavage enzyme
MPEKIIITAALSGSVTMKEHHPAVPYTPEEFAEEAGAADSLADQLEHRG